MFRSANCVPPMRTPASIEDKIFILTEYSAALRERELAKVVLGLSSDPDVLKLAKMVRDGHQMDRMDEIARAMKLRTPLRRRASIRRAKSSKPMSPSAAIARRR